MSHLDKSLYSRPIITGHARQSGWLDTSPVMRSTSNSLGCLLPALIIVFIAICIILH